MMMPWEKSKAWAGRWCEVVVALLLAKPLAATVLAAAIKLFADSTSFAGWQPALSAWFLPAERH